MNVSIFKPRVKTVWLDTSIIVKLAMIRAGFKLSEIDETRVETFYNLCRSKVDSKQLLCPGGGKEEEIWKGFKTCEDIIVSLSLGIDFKHRRSIQSRQIFAFMKAYINGLDTVELPYGDAFYRDPVEELLSVRTFVITVSKQRPDESIQECKKIKQNILNDWETIRQGVQTRHESFEDRFQKECSGYIQGLIQLGVNATLKMRQGRIPTFDDFMGLLSLEEPLGWWEKLGGEPHGLDGLVAFYLSDVFKQVPIVSISCKLISKILTESVRIEDGDSMDVQLIASYLPYCHGIVTDRKMKNRLRSLGIDQKYNTKVFSLEDFDDLMAFVSN